MGIFYFKKKINGEVLHTFNIGAPLAGLHQVDNGNKFMICSQQGNVMSRELDDTSVKAFDIARSVERFRYCDETNQFLVCGGRNTLSQVFDVEKQSEVWKAKNVANDFLDLLVPIWDRDVAWLNEPVGSSFISVTAYHQVRIYDIRAAKKPTTSVEIGDSPITRVRINPLNWNQCAIADTKGDLSLLDIRKNFHNIGGYKGIAGSIRDIDFHPSIPAISAVGLDRFLHLFDTKTRKSIIKIYLKQRLNKVLFSQYEMKIELPEQSEEKSEELSEELNIEQTTNEKDPWELLETVAETKKPKKKKINTKRR